MKRLAPVKGRKFTNDYQLTVRIRVSKYFFTFSVVVARGYVRGDIAHTSPRTALRSADRPDGRTDDAFPATASITAAVPSPIAGRK